MQRPDLGGARAMLKVQRRSRSMPGIQRTVTLPRDSESELRSDLCFARPRLIHSQPTEADWPVP